MTAPTDLVVLIGHGTRSPEGQDEFRALAALAEQRWPAAVRAGFIEFASPTLEDAAQAASKAGATRITVAPVVLVGAGHLKDDAAWTARRVRELAPEAEVRLAPQLGASNELLDLAAARVRELEPEPPEGLLVVGRGSSDAAANAELAAIARLLGERLGASLVQEAFVSLATPSVPEGLERLRRLGARRITLAPWWLFAGVLLDRARDQARSFADTHGLELRIAERFGPDEQVLDAVWFNVVDAWRGVRTSCDRCHWRLPFAARRPAPSAPPEPLARIEIGLASPEPGRLAAFWATLLGYRVGDFDRDGVYLDLVPPRPDLPVVFIQRVHDEGRGRVHLDLYGTDLEALRSRALALGATQCSERRTGSEGGSWYIMEDPEGTPFCIMQTD